MIINDLFEKLHFVIYTNESSIPLSEVSLKEFLLNCPPDSKVSVVSNNIINLNDSSISKYYFNAEVPQMNGKQFSTVMSKFLDHINEEFILFNCDDYIIYNQIDKKGLNTILNLMTNHNIDYFSFDRKLYCDTKTFDAFNNEYFPQNLINIIPKSHYYRFSVQPCIWRKSSLINLFEKFKNISVHDLETNEEIRQLDFLCLGINWDQLGLHLPSDGIYSTHFYYSWAEIVRSGVFISSKNGFPVNDNTYNCRLIIDLIEKYQMQTTNLFDKFLYKMKITN